MGLPDSQSFGACEEKKVWCFWTGTTAAWLCWSDVSCNPHRLMACQLIVNTFSVFGSFEHTYVHSSQVKCLFEHMFFISALWIVRCRLQMCFNKHWDHEMWKQYSSLLYYLFLKYTKIHGLSQRAGASLSSQVLCVHNLQLRLGLQICSC